jgi:hypothetical protein
MTSLQGATGLYANNTASSLFSGQSGQTQSSHNNAQQGIMSMMQMLMGMIVGLLEGEQQKQGSQNKGTQVQSQPNFGGFGAPAQSGTGCSGGANALSLAGVGGGLGNFLA